LSEFKAGTAAEVGAVLKPEFDAGDDARYPAPMHNRSLSIILFIGAYSDVHVPVEDARFTPKSGHVRCC